MEEQIDKMKLKELPVDAQQGLDPAALFRPGSVILEKYLVVKLLGVGGMGSVYQVTDVQSKTDFALKYLTSQHTNDVVWRRFDNEARAANRLDHPNLIKVYDSGLLPDGQPYFVMDLVHGKTLSDELSDKTRLPLVRTLKLMIQVAFAMAYAHDNGVIHRDIKPSNIMIGNSMELTEGNVKLVDFGIAKLTGKDGFNQLTLTRTGDIFGSPLYMSPEQCAGIASDHRSDLYSFGCVMYETLTGAPPILADNALSTMIKHQSERPVSMKQASLGVTFPGASERIVSKLLEKSPDQRYQSAHELIADLVSLEQHLVSGSSEPSVVRKNSPDVRAKHPFAVGFLSGHVSIPIAALILVAGFLAGFFSGRLSMPPAQSLTGAPVELKKEDMFARNRNEKVSDDAPNSTRPFSTVAGSHRTFLFPTDSLGHFHVEGEKDAPAQEVVAVDNFKPVTLIASEYLCRNPAYLSRFRPDELGKVELSENGSNLAEILQRLIPIKSLRYLKITDSNVTNPCLQAVGEMSGLESLDIAGSNISGRSFAKLKNLHDLKELKLSNIFDVKPLMSALKSMPDLNMLVFCNSSMDANDIAAIGSLTTLRTLDLTSTAAVNDSSLAQLVSLRNLKALDLEKCNITPRSIDTFKKMKSLHLVHISRAHWTKEQRRMLETAVYPCKVDWRGGPDAWTSLNAQAKEFEKEHQGGNK